MSAGPALGRLCSRLCSAGTGADGDAAVVYAARMAATLDLPLVLDPAGLALGGQRCVADRVRQVVDCPCVKSGGRRSGTGLCSAGHGSPGAQVGGLGSGGAGDPAGMVDPPAADRAGDHRPEQLIDRPVELFLALV